MFIGVSRTRANPSTLNEQASERQNGGAPGLPPDTHVIASRVVSSQVAETTQDRHYDIRVIGSHYLRSLFGGFGCVADGFACVTGALPCVDAWANVRRGPRSFFAPLSVPGCTPDLSRIKSRSKASPSCPVQRHSCRWDTSRASAVWTRFPSFSAALLRIIERACSGSWITRAPRSVVRGIVREAFASAVPRSGLVTIHLGQRNPTIGAMPYAS